MNSDFGLRIQIDEMQHLEMMIQVYREAVDVQETFSGFLKDRVKREVR